MLSCPYEWQPHLYPAWRHNNFRGILKATTGAGKTIATCIALQSYLIDHPDARIIILALRKEIITQWQKELINHSIEADVLSYMSFVSKCAQNKLEPYDVLIADECRNLLTPVQSRTLDYHTGHILGLSATPETSDRIIGPIIMSIDYDEADICPFTVHYHRFPLTSTQRASYQRKTERVKESMRKNPHDRINWAILDRRAFCYDLEQRIPLAINLIEQNEGRRIMLFCERQKQAITLSQALTDSGTPHALHLSSKKDLQRFLSHEVDIVISCKMLQEGFNDPSADVAILVSSATTARSNIQIIGRVIRPMPGKHADIYVLLAENTSDEQTIKAVKWPNNICIKNLKVML